MLIEKVAEKINEKGYETKIKTVAKTDGKKQGLYIITENPSSPVFYEETLDEMMDKLGTYDNIASECIDMAVNSPDFLENLTNAEFVRHNVRLCVCNETAEDFLENSISFPVDGTDLVAYARIFVGDNATTKVTKELLASCNISAAELLKEAEENTRKKICVRDMGSILNDAGVYDFPVVETPLMLVITSDDAYYGASAIAIKDVLKEARDMLNCETITLIPSSIHELIATPYTGDVSEIIQDVNRTVLREGEYLGSYPYYFNGEEITMTI